MISRIIIGGKNRIQSNKINKIEYKINKMIEKKENNIEVYTMKNIDKQYFCLNFLSILLNNFKLKDSRVELLRADTVYNLGSHKTNKFLIKYKDIYLGVYYGKPELESSSVSKSSSALTPELHRKNRETEFYVRIDYDRTIALNVYDTDGLTPNNSRSTRSSRSNSS